MDFTVHGIIESLSEFGIYDRGHKQRISNGGRFKPAFDEKDKTQTMIDIRGISTNWFKASFVPP
jgi:hypothetical protein